MPVESAIYRHDWSDLTNAFTAQGYGFGFTKHTRWFGLRIDHLLASRQFRVERCQVQTDVASDHRPLLADLTWTADERLSTE
jgi:endonuclease/exonuclease/phosphatase (EEP) superfamily protein YafD